MEQKLIFNGFYRGYKHDPAKGFDNELYQVINISHSKNGPKSGLVIYRPLQRSLVYLLGKHFDHKNLKTWHRRVKQGNELVPRYTLIETVYERFACKQLVKELYGTGEASFFGVEPSAELVKVYERPRPMVANYAARTALLLVAEYGPEGVSDTELVTAIGTIDDVVPMKSERFGITSRDIISNLVKDFYLKDSVEVFTKPGSDELYYRAR